ncbi:MAG: hypothetical protein HC929_24575 [Leptolyngbyaceae cyanobacterium SM2_5_2]|nr:hypothetical protein [Leptolyngbyaceae cyanobacterium SM2_5_2]
MNITLTAGTYLVDAATGQSPRQSFRRPFPLSLPTGGQAQTLYFTPDTQLQGKFLPLTFNAIAAGAVVPAMRANQGGGGAGQPESAPAAGAGDVC